MDTKLNLDLLVEMVEWAELNENLALNHMPEHYRTWGEWNQGSWARIDASDLPEALQKEWKELWNSLDDGHVIDEAAADELTQKAVNHCQTSFCIAGQVVNQAGYRMLFTIDDLTADYCVPQRPTDRLDEKGRTIWEDIPDADRQNIG